MISTYLLQIIKFATVNRRSIYSYVISFHNYGCHRGWQLHQKPWFSSYAEQCRFASDLYYWKQFLNINRELNWTTFISSTTRMVYKLRILFLWNLYSRRYAWFKMNCLLLDSEKTALKKMWMLFKHSIRNKLLGVSSLVRKLDLKLW